MRKHPDEYLNGNLTAMIDVVFQLIIFFVATVSLQAYPDSTQFDPKSKYYDEASNPADPRWDWVTVAPVKKLTFISLDDLRTMPELADCRLLARGNRLSVIPLTDLEFAAIVARGSKK